MHFKITSESVCLNKHFFFSEFMVSFFVFEFKRSLKRNFSIGMFVVCLILRATNKSFNVKILYITKFMVWFLGCFFFVLFWSFILFHCFIYKPFVLQTNIFHVIQQLLQYSIVEIFYVSKWISSYITPPNVSLHIYPWKRGVWWSLPTFIYSYCKLSLKCQCVSIK